MTEYAPVTPEVVAWAIDESGLSPDEIARRVKVTPAAVSAWATGAEKPTKGELTRFAETLKRPRAMFFLPEAPGYRSSLPDGLRKVAGVREQGKQELTFKERLWVRQARRLQRLLASLVDQQPHIPLANRREDPRDVAERIRRWTGITTETRREWTSPSQAFRSWREALEAEGLVVLALPMGKDSVQGFALAHHHAPVIAVNTAAIYEARIFTLFHELAHLALGGDSSCSEKNNGRLERWCDRVASHVLIPRAQLLAMTETTAYDDLELVKRIARQFKISLRAAAIALEDINKVEKAYQKVEEAWPSADRDKKGGGGIGRTSPKKCIDEYGGFTVATIISALNSGKIDELKVRDYLRLDSTQLAEAGQLLRERP